MRDAVAHYQVWVEEYPWLETVTSLVLLIMTAWVANWITRHVLVRGLRHLLNATSWSQDSALSPMRAIERLSNVVPALVLILGIPWVPGLPEAVAVVVDNVGRAFVVLTLALAAGKSLNIVNALYLRRADAHLRPIKGYLEVVKIAIYVVAAILIVASLMDRSPLILLSGLGAMAAVLMLVFQDTLLSLVASVQLSSNDMVRLGDWIEMPAQNADGDVIDIALHTVKVQNWDKTITTIPTKKLISDSFKNWRGMRESGGRRIKRSLYLDQHSVRFLTADEIARLSRFALLRPYLGDKQHEISRWNERFATAAEAEVNHRRLTNIGTFRAYVERYLRSHPGVHQDMTLMVRQMAPTSEGLPLEIYCFANTIVWVNYEATQSDIFDHLLAIVPEFGLQVFQAPSGMDMRALAEARAEGVGV